MMSRSGTRFALLVSLVLNYALLCDAAPAMTKKKVAEEATAAEEAARLANLVVMLGIGMEMNKKLLYGLTGMVTIALYVAWMVKMDSSIKARGNRPGNDAALDVVVVATGLPKKGMVSQSEQTTNNRFWARAFLTCSSFLGLVSFDSITRNAKG
jgi:hypothetical protein